MMKALLAEDFAQLFTPVFEEVKSLYHGVIKTQRFNGNSARVWVNFAPELTNR